MLDALSIDPLLECDSDDTSTDCRRSPDPRNWTVFTNVEIGHIQISVARRCWNILRLWAAGPRTGKPLEYLVILGTPRQASLILARRSARITRINPPELGSGPFLRSRLS
jgi:hypothetical protein